MLTCSQNPENKFWPKVTNTNQPWTRWWWHGNAVDAPTLTAHLTEFKRVGIGGVEITPIYGVQGTESQVIPYLSEKWIEMLNHTIREANRLNLGVDMPPNSGWRTGGPMVPIENANAALEFFVKEVKFGDYFDPEPTSNLIQAIVAYSASGEIVDLTDHFKKLSVSSWTIPSGTWKIYTIMSKWSGQKVKRAAPGNEGYAIDPFSPKAVDYFFQFYAQKIKNVPHGAIRTYFHDSFEYEGNWSANIFDEFYKRRGYNLKEHLPALLGEGNEDEIKLVKADYRETLSDMLLENFIQPFTKWSNALGSQSRNQAHGSPGNLLDLYAAVDIPETEIFGPLSGPAADLFINKFASSAGNVGGKKLISAESYTWLNEHFTVTLAEMKQATDHLFLAGINHIFFHGTAYSPSDAAWPGWVFYASSQINPQNPIWRDLPALNQYITRCQSLLQSGEPDNDILLYWPFLDILHDSAGLMKQLEVQNPNWFYDQPFGQLAKELYHLGYSFDYISDRQLLESYFQDDIFKTHGGNYRTLIIPACQYISLESFKKLIELAKSGATILFQNHLPVDVPGFSNLAGRRLELDSLKAGLNSLENGKFLIVQDFGAALRQMKIYPEKLVLRTGIQYLRRKMVDGHLYFIANMGDLTIDDYFPLTTNDESVILMNPMHGQVGCAALHKNPAGKTEIRLQLKPHESVFIKTFENKTHEAPEWVYLEPANQTELTGHWRIEFIAGGPTLPPAIETDQLISWTRLGGETIENFAGTAWYTIEFDDPGIAEKYLISFEKIAESGRIFLNGKETGTLISPPWEIRIGSLKPTGNLLRIEVTNLAANQIRYLDRSGIKWRIFHDINFVNIDYQPFDASNWKIRDSGLIGKVYLVGLKS
ncbi:hypothetical protein JW964_28500 [candidate division KSB1 bacterium]|nr:hypothetical protein [candidate division KSB1 bacterium]